jgi:capsular exopolysaccharide synthesis family protein
MTTDTAQPTLGSHIAALRRQKYVIISTTLLVAGVVLFLSLHQTKIHQASAEVLLSRQNLGSAVTGTQDPYLSSDPTRVAQTQVDIARLPRVAKRALANAGLAVRSAGSLLDNSSVSSNTNSDILTFRVNDPIPAIATKLATAYATAYTTYSLQLGTQTLKRARLELEGRLTGLRGNGGSSSATYRLLEERVQLIRTLELLQNTGVVVKEAGGANQVKPTPRRNTMLGAMFGLLLGIGLAFLWEALDNRVRSESEIEDRLDLPVLARVPAPTGHLPGEKGLAMLDDLTGMQSEVMRRLRVKFEFANLDVRARRVMITSGIEEEGKSTTIANLAVALALSGRKVALVDLDLRSPSIAGFFDLEDRPGITDVAQGRIVLADAMVPVGLGASSRLVGGADAGSLSVLPAGVLPANPGEFVGTSTLADVLEGLGRKYELVLVDSPPICIVGDAMTLSAHVDGLIVVARLGVVDRRTLDELARELKVSQAPTLGVIITGTEPGSNYGNGYYS